MDGANGSGKGRLGYVAKLFKVGGWVEVQVVSM